MALGSQLLFSLLLLLLGFGLHHRQLVHAEQLVTCFNTENSDSRNLPNDFLTYYGKCSGNYPHVTIWSKRDSIGREYKDLAITASDTSPPVDPSAIYHEPCIIRVNQYADCIQTETFARYFMEPSIQPAVHLQKRDFNPISTLLDRCVSEVDSEWKEKGRPDHFALISGVDGKIIKHFGMSKISMPQYDCNPSLWLEVRKPVSPTNAVEIRITGMSSFILITFDSPDAKLSNLRCSECSGYGITVNEFATASSDSKCYPMFDAIYVYGSRVAQQTNRGSFPTCHPQPHFVDINGGYVPNSPANTGANPASPPNPPNPNNPVAPSGASGAAGAAGAAATGAAGAGAGGAPAGPAGPTAQPAPADSSPSAFLQLAAFPLLPHLLHN